MNRLLQGWRYYYKLRSYLSRSHRRNLIATKLLRERFYKQYWEQAAGALNASIEDCGYGFHRIRKNGRVTIVRLSDVMMDSRLMLNLMGNKPLTYRFLIEGRYPVPKHLAYKLSSIDQAHEFLANCKSRVVVKPGDGTGAGAGVTCNISNIKQLNKASSLAAVFSDILLIEEELKGGSYRLLYLNGEFIDAIRREPPHVIGDGFSSVKELMLNNNRKRMQGNPVIALNPLLIDYECKETLHTQGIGLEFVPANGQQVLVKSAVNQNCANENHIVREEIHPSVAEMGAEIMRNFNIKLGGIDIIAENIAIPLSESGGVINEINTTPGLHHHALVAEQEKKIPLGELLLSELLGES